MSRKSLVISGLVVLVMLLSLVPAFGCVTPASPTPTKPPTPVKPEKVIIHHFGDLSGPYAPITAPIVTGLADFIEWFNAKGGIDGVPLEQMFRDTGGKLDAALAAYAAFREMKPKPIVVILYGSAEAEALRERFVEDKIFAFSCSPSPTALYPPGYEFSTIPSYCDSIGAFIDWVTEDWAKKTGQKVKLAFLSWDSTYGRAIMVDEVRNYAREKGVEIVAEEVFGLRDMDVTTQLTRIKAKGANWVYDNTLAHAPGVISRSAKALGILNQDLYDTTPGTIHRASGPWGMDESAVRLAGPLLEGMVGPRSFASWAMTDVPGVKEAIASFEKHHRKPEERVMGYLVSWAAVYTIAHAIEGVVKELGWGKLSGETLREQFLKMKDFSPLGMTRYTFTADKPEPRQTRIFQVKGGKLLPITDWVTCPDLRPAKYR